MSLKFGFGLYDNDPAGRSHWEKKYEALTEDDKKFFHEVLPFVLIRVDVGIIIRETIPVIWSRLRLVDKAWYEELRAAKQDDLYLKQKFIGYQANVRTMNHQEFKQKVIQQLFEWVIPISKENVKRLESNGTDGILLDEMPIEDLPLLINRKWRNKLIEEDYKEMLSNG